jgi:hypothetical protein
MGCYILQVDYNNNFRIEIVEIVYFNPKLEVIVVEYNSL